MSVINVMRAAAAAGVGVDLVDGSPTERVSYDRVLTGVALVGSASPGDMDVEILVGLQQVYVISNSALGLGISRTHVLSTRVRIPAGQKVSARVLRAAVTQPVRIMLHFLP